MPLVDRFMQVYGTLNPVEEAPYPSLEDDEGIVCYFFMLKITMMGMVTGLFLWPIHLTK
jgi:hypothetical protein